MSSEYNLTKEDIKKGYTLQRTVIQLTSKHFRGNKLNVASLSNKTGIIKFYAPWCPHCINMVADLKFLAHHLYDHGFFVASVDVTKDESKAVAQKFKVSGIPALYKYDGSNMSKLDTNDRSIDGLLDSICKFTKKCCKKTNNGIECN